ncbi:cytochrome c oxidase accessory protein CcoG [Fulvivirga sedimenti]|uniref:Cytochrome c oxidase accessory protein CcoG n=1 Tax=Fulvivirga sedimenti TaxID=2879465 RepID=A0A9X1HJH7_9BACT|nr:cytochrome c oxidase accessory protein CcoG [Fulvivirga sedimenti]MCA6073258.1 cytochrome c oxidase accessory protein CcoG [Fulvivirga sedimenti]
MNQSQGTEELYQFDEEFRDTIATVDAEGKRIWVYPKKPAGRFHNYRILVTIVLLGILFAGPFIKIGGEPLLMLNFFDRKFVILGQIFWPQDFFLLALLLITLFVFIILFTVSFGRIWCGWACPQTLFMEMVFRKIEYWIEGDANKQRKLDKGPWNTEKIWKKTLKHVIFLAIAILISHTVMAYLIGIEEVKEIVSQPPTEHLTGFIGLMAFTGIFYWVFAYFREQACVAVCPYGRLQGVLLDTKSIVIAYDWLRGEPRGKISKNKEADQSKGDCIDCKLCVHACPTGIDIRNGTQLECVNCTACIDACDEVMDKVDRPRGLIRYASHESIAQGKTKLFTTRVKAYTAVLILLVSVLSFFLFTRSEVEATILKVPGQLYQRQENGDISNLFNIQFINKTSEEMTIELIVDGAAGAKIEKVGGDTMIVPPNELSEGIFFITIPKSGLQGMQTPLKVTVMGNGKEIETKNIKFLGPANLSD